MQKNNTMGDHILMDSMHSSKGERSSAKRTPRKLDRIPLREVQRSPQTKVTDFLRKAVCLEGKENRAERVENTKVNFTENVERIEIKLNRNYLDYIPEALHEDFIRTTECIIIDFKQFSDQAVGSNEEGAKVPGFKKQGEARTKELNKWMNEMCEDLDRWKQVYDAREEFKKALNYVPEKYRSLVCNLVDRQTNAVQMAYKQVLRDYPTSRDSLMSDLRFREACRCLEAIPHKLEEACKQEIEIYKGKIEQDSEEISLYMRTNLDKVEHNKRSYLVDLNKRYRQELQQYQKEYPNWEKELNPAELLQKISEKLKSFNDMGKEFQDLQPLKRNQDLRMKWINLDVSNNYLLACLRANTSNAYLSHEINKREAEIKSLRNYFNRLLKELLNNDEANLLLYHQANESIKDLSEQKNFLGKLLKEEIITISTI